MPDPTGPNLFKTSFWPCETREELNQINGFLIVAPYSYYEYEEVFSEQALNKQFELNYLMMRK